MFLPYDIVYTITHFLTLPDICRFNIVLHTDVSPIIKRRRISWAATHLTPHIHETLHRRRITPNCVSAECVGRRCVDFIDLVHTNYIVRHIPYCGHCMTNLFVNPHSPLYGMLYVV